MNRNDHPPAPIAGELVLEFRGRRVETEDEIIEIEDALGGRSAAMGRAGRPRKTSAAPTVRRPGESFPIEV